MIAAFAPLLDVAIQLLASILLGVGSWAAWRVTTWLRLSNDEKVRGYLNTALENAVTWAAAEARRRVIPPGGTPGPPDLAPEAVQYVVQRVPGALAHFGITPDGVRDMVEKRLARVGA